MRARSPSLLFAGRFLVIFALLMGAFEASRGTAVERLLVDDGILVPTTALIGVLAPREHIDLVGHSIRSPTSRLNVTRGCEGIEVVLLLFAGVLAFPATWQARAEGLVIGFAVAYILAVARLIALHFTLRYAPGAWEALHGLVLPLGPIVVVTLYFLHWSGRSLAPSDRRRPHAA
jgi:exosortase family protein XrtM